MRILKILHILQTFQRFDCCEINWILQRFLLFKLYGLSVLFSGNFCKGNNLLYRSRFIANNGITNFCIHKILKNTTLFSIFIIEIIFYRSTNGQIIHTPYFGIGYQPPISFLLRTMKQRFQFLHIFRILAYIRQCLQYRFARCIPHTDMGPFNLANILKIFITFIIDIIRLYDTSPNNLADSGFYINNISRIYGMNKFPYGKTIIPKT